MSDIILGSSGYLARTLLKFIAGDVVCISGRRQDADFRVDLSASLLEDDDPMFKLRPSRLFLLARPPMLDYLPNRIFYSNLQRLLQAWCESPSLQTVHFMSTSLVYSGDVELSGSNPGDTAPYGMYEYFKLEGELFLEYLVHSVRPDIDFNVWRLPLAFGGAFDANEDGNQFIYSFISAYMEGQCWSFDRTSDERYGTSWFYAPEFMQRLVAWPYQGGGIFRRQVSSGFFSYKQMHQWLSPLYQGETTPTMRLYRTRFELYDEAGMTPLQLEELINDKEMFVV